MKLCIDQFGGNWQVKPGDVFDMMTPGGSVRASLFVLLAVQTRHGWTLYAQTTFVA